MDDITQQQAYNRFITLPEIVRVTISDPATHSTIERIGLAHELTRVEVGLLAQATSLLMMGFIEPNKYVAVLIDQLTISQEVAATIAQEINRDIFNVIKDALKDVHGITKTPTSTVTAAVPAAPQKIGPSSYAATETVAAIVAPQIMPSMPIVTAPKMDAPPAPSPFMATLNVAAMKAEPVVPPVLVIPSPQANEMQEPLPQAPFEEPMRTIAMDQPRVPIMTPPSVLVGTTAPLQNMPTPEQPPMNIFEEKLGTAFRMKSESVESVVAAPLNTSPVVPSTPANPLPQAMPAMSLPRTPSAPMIGVVPTPTAPTIPPPMVGGDPYRETP